MAKQEQKRQQRARRLSDLLALVLRRPQVSKGTPTPADPRRSGMSRQPEEIIGACKMMGTNPSDSFETVAL